MAKPKSSEHGPHGTTLERTFERKIWRAKLAMIFEQVWRRIWLALLIAGAFTLVSLFGIWTALPPLAHKVLLGAFAISIAAAMLSLFFIRWPTRSTAIRRIERVSNVPHRPASSYEDTLTVAEDNPETTALWTAHRKRLAALFQRLRAGNPKPRTDRYDPFALRALMLVLIATGLGLVGLNSVDRLRAAFDVENVASLATVRLDAWLSPPAYTGKPPQMLSDGATPIVAVTSDAASQNLKPVTVPGGSTLVVRVRGIGRQKAKVATYTSESFDDSNATPIAAEKSVAGGDVQEFRTKIASDSMVRVGTDGGTQLGRFYISVIPDALPTIKLTEPPRGTHRGSMKLAYEVKDDYGITGAIAHFVEVKPKDKREGSGGDRRLQLPSIKKPSSPQPPLEMTLRLPGRQSSDNRAQTYLDFAPTRWAGRRAIMTLKAKDVADQSGVSPGLEIILPERQFTKPLAKAIIEQRRKLFDDPNARRREVALALNALTTDPQEFFDDLRVYLSLRSVFHRLQTSGEPEQIQSSIEQLWHTALRIEDGDLSDAERAVRDAHDKLAKALEEGASEEEIEKLMQELREAMNNFMRQMAKEGQNQRDFTQGNDPNNQSVNQNDIEEMMRNIEELAKTGAREQAQQMLSQMRDMMERMRQGQGNPQQARQQQQRMEALRKLGGMLGDQQELMDDTFTQQNHGQAQAGQRMGQQRNPGQFGPRGQRGQVGPQGQQSQQRGINPGQQQNQFGRGNQRGQRGSGQQGRGQNPQPNAQQLADRQRQLQDQLAALQRQMAEQGIGRPEQLESARQAMERAEQALRDQNLPRAMQEQARALSHMQQGARSMAQEMQSNSPQQFGSQGQERRDPLGRPQRSSGPELGTSVKVPEEIELQRAREIIDELRRRRGEVTRPMIELEYLDRLLRRF